VFVGVLSMKLLVPRPPAGAGPDVHTDLAADEPHEIVEPPARTLPTSAFAAAPPLVPARANEATAIPLPVDTAIVGGDRYAARGGAFAPPVTDPPASFDPGTPPRRDPFVTAASFEEPVDLPPSTPPQPAPPEAGAADDLRRPIPLDTPLPLDERPAPLAAGLSAEPSRVAAPGSLAGGHVARPGDTWWSIAERAYGDGRLYRALFAWNRTVDPRITLAPGTPLEIPPLPELAAAWPHLLPAQP
jgi:5'-nucleotidase